MHTLSHSQRLSLLEKKFINWQRKKRSGEQIPARLWLEAFELCNHMKYCKVANRLGIGHGNFKKRLLLHNLEWSSKSGHVFKRLFSKLAH